MGTGSETVTDERTHRHLPIDILLPRLGRVQDRGRGQWFASCSTAAHAHGDRSRGLSIRELPDRTLLLHCHAGCSVGDIVAAVGLELSDLFPPSLEPRRSAGRSQHRLAAKDALEIIKHEAMTIACAAEFLVDGTATDAELERVIEATIRIHRVIGAATDGR